MTSTINSTKMSGRITADFLRGARLRTCGVVIAAPEIIVTARRLGSNRDFLRFGELALMDPSQLIIGRPVATVFCQCQFQDQQATAPPRLRRGTGLVFKGDQIGGGVDVGPGG